MSIFEHFTALKDGGTPQTNVSTRMY